MPSLNIQLFENPNGWGPTNDNTPKKFENVPYSPLTLVMQRQQSREQQQQQLQQQQQESFRLGKIADWTAPVNIREQHRRAAISVGGTAATTGASRAAVHQQYQQQQQQKQREEESFNVVSHTNTSRKTTSSGGGAVGGAWASVPGRGGARGGGRGGGRGGARGGASAYGRGGRGGSRGRGGRGRGRGGRFGYYHHQRALPTSRSVSVKKTWDEKAHFDLDQMKKLKLKHMPTVVEEVRECGFTQYYDTTNDFVGLKKRRALNASMEKTFFNVTTSDDPVIREIATQDKGNAKDVSSYTVYTTDTLLSVLMSSVRSVYPWDIVIEKDGNQIYLDKRPNNVAIDLLTVNETAKEPPTLDSTHNSMQFLRKEATWVNQIFSQQALRPAKTGKFEYKHPNPFQEDQPDEKISSTAYRYRRWQVSNELSFVVRSEVDAVVTGSDSQPTLATVKSLLEYPNPPTSPGQGYEYGTAGLVDWRSNLDTQRGSVLVTEFKNNSNKIARWIAQALLAGSQQFRLGFVSRAAPTSSKRHHLMGVERIIPQQFASQMDINMNNMWAIVKNVIEQIIKDEDGRYVLIKEPTKSDLNLYLLPEGENPDDEVTDEEDQDSQSVTTGTEDEHYSTH